MAYKQGQFVQHRKRESDKDVYSITQERIRYIFDNYDTPLVSTSGGKDSTVVVFLALEEAKQRRQRLKVFHCDEEINDPDTLAHLENLRNHPDIEFYWFCLPIRHTLRSQSRTGWITWDEDQKENWFRPMPKGAITWTDVPDFKLGTGIKTLVPLYFSFDKYGTVCEMTGVRTQESFNRIRSMLISGEYITQIGKFAHYAKPIYDWKVEDVWWYIRTSNIDYSKIYDKMQKLGRALVHQRVAPWGNVASGIDANQWAEFYPDAWEKALRRLPELRPFARYANTTLYKRNTADAKPPGATWQEWTMSQLEALPPSDRSFWTREIKNQVLKWRNYHNIPFPDEPLGGGDGFTHVMSWKKICQMITKNDRIGGNSRDKL